MINRRINKLKIEIKGAIDDSNKFIKDEYIIIAIDNTGIKITNRRDHWLRDKWNVKNKKGYLKIR